MTIRFSADEVFAMAEKIEKNGSAFYRRAAGIFKGDSDINRLLLDLARMEEEHRVIFAAMRAEIAGKEREATVFDPDNQVIDYLNAVANKNVFDINKDSSKILKGRESPEEVIHMAIGAEKDSIIFYLGLKDMIPERSGRNKIDDIINEEKNHIVLLAKWLKVEKA